MAKIIAQDVLAMSRGTLVVDECVQELKVPLAGLNIRILSPRPGEKDRI
jgi:hypothetical protein